MKHFLLAFLFLGIGLSATAQKVDYKQLDAAEKFYKAVISGKKAKVLKCMDKDYRKEQIKFLGGNKQQFVDELFGGFNPDTKEYVTIKLSEVRTMEIEDVKELSENSWEYRFVVTGNNQTFEMILELKKSGKNYGFVGAVG